MSHAAAIDLGTIGLEVAVATLRGGIVWSASRERFRRLNRRSEPSPP